MGTTGYHASQDWDAAEDIGINLVLKNVHALQETLAPAPPQKAHIAGTWPWERQVHCRSRTPGKTPVRQELPCEHRSQKEKLSSLNVLQGPSTDEASSYAGWQRKDV